MPNLKLTARALMAGMLAVLVLAAVSARAADAPAAPDAAAASSPSAVAAPSTPKPPLPAPLQTLVTQGAQLRYLGREGGLDGWIAIQNGNEQYFYVTPDQESFVLGLQFDKNGKVITLRQVQKLQKESGSDTLDYLASGIKPDVKDTSKPEPNKAFKTPAEKLYADVEGGNWLPLGSPTAPYVYMLVDPECPFCEKFMNALRPNYITNNLIQVRILPVGFHGQASIEQAAFLLAAPNPQQLYFRHLDGDKTALPATGDINTQGIQHNMSIMQTWKLNATPTTVYRAKNGQVKIFQGAAKDIPALIQDIAPAR